MYIKNVLRCWPLLLALGLMSSLTLSAQQSHAHKGQGFSCGVVRQAEGEARDGLRSFPSYPSKERTREVIYKSDYIHVFRLAVAITPSMYRSEFRSNKNEVTKFWNELEKYLNNIYQRDCGIRFEIIRDYKLILQGDEPGDLAGTKFINEAIGKDAYDVGILIKNSRQGGEAILNAIHNPDSKAAVYARKNYEVVAHELGHMFGADHTHGGARGNDGIYVEPGEGTSLMSYGYPRSFFALSSIADIRASLEALGYYTDKARTKPGTKYVAPNAPYVVPLTAKKPKLKHEDIRPEYVVTEGTRFQFHIPTTEPHDARWLYNAHPYDAVKSLSKAYTNLLQPSYPSERRPYVMYQPRYNFPVGNMNSVEERLLPHTNSFHKGLYTYLLSAHSDEGHHDSRKVRLRIVEGEAFKITEFAGPSTDTHTAIAGVTKLSLKWQTCSTLYGEGSKVRILLSTDFGETFPYILADNEPNDGSWEGVCPYIEAGKVSRPFVNREVRGAILKLEVIGEAAYSVTHEQHYGVENRKPVGTGGFLIEERAGEISFSPKPEVSVRYARRDAVPAIPRLTASYAGESREVVGQEVQQGNSLRRTWTVSLGSKTATYTQIITWEEGNADEATLLHRAIEEVQRNATTLYRNLGQLGYPKKRAPLAIAFARNYEAVFTSQGAPKQGITLAQVRDLEQKLSDIANLPDGDIVLPVSGGKYKIASLHSAFGREYLYYLLSQQGSASNTTTSLDDAAVWECQEENGLYSFTCEGHEININGFNRSDTHIAVQRGYTWGSFALIGSWEYETPRMAYFTAAGGFAHFIDIRDKSELNDLKVNKPGFNSTDFRFFAVEGHPEEEDTPTPPPTYSVTLEQSQGGKISIEGVDLNAVPQGTQLTVGVQLEEGYELIRLEAGGQDITTNHRFEVQGSVSVRATFALKTFKVTLPSAAEGRISVEGDIDLERVPYGTELRLVVSPSEGYRLKSLMSGSVDLTESLSLVVKTSHTLVAVWEALPKKNTSVTELEAKAASIYPNPAESVLYLQGAVQGSHYELLDLSGLIVRTGMITSEEEAVALDGLPQGVYILRLGGQRHKVVKR